MSGSPDLVDAIAALEDPAVIEGGPRGGAGVADFGGNPRVVDELDQPELPCRTGDAAPAADHHGVRAHLAHSSEKPLVWTTAAVDAEAGGVDEGAVAAVLPRDGLARVVAGHAAVTDGNGVGGTSEAGPVELERLDRAGLARVRQRIEGEVGGTGLAARRVHGQEGVRGRTHDGAVRRILRARRPVGPARESLG